MSNSEMPSSPVKVKVRTSSTVRWFLREDRARSWIGFAAAIAPLLLLCLTSLPSFADRGGYVIQDFHTELTVQSNSDLFVSERILVEFSEPRHGIYRLIPNQYRDRQGFQYSFAIEDLSVTDENGREHGTQVSRDGRYVRIRIGDADREVTGQVHYLIRYRVRDALGHFPNYDELYWNATGNEWEAPIFHASASIELPVELPSDSLLALAFVGQTGSQAEGVQITVPRAGRIEFEYAQALAPLEGLTVVANWPHGYVQFPSSGTRVARFFADNWILLAPFLALFVLVRRYRSSGRDPHIERSIAVQYQAPPNLTPGEIGTLIDEGVDLRDITATVIDLAVRGHVRIEVTEESALLGLIKKDEVVFHLLRDKNSPELRPHEREVLSALFESGDRVEASDLREKFYRKIPAIHTAIEDRLVQEGYFAGSPKKVRNRYRLIGFGAGLVVFFAGIAWSASRGSSGPPVAPILAGVFTFVLFLLFARSMPRRTAAGVEMRNWALGFEEFVDRVESDRLERAERRNVFETLLPYAMALGVSKTWAKRFENIYKEQPPVWYGGPGFHGDFGTTRFEKSLSSSMGAVGSSMTASPRSSSGSGGGGFSGGGGGGGGGGSW